MYCCVCITPFDSHCFSRATRYATVCCVTLRLDLLLVLIQFFSVQSHACVAKRNWPTIIQREVLSRCTCVETPTTCTFCDWSVIWMYIWGWNDIISVSSTVRMWTFVRCCWRRYNSSTVNVRALPSTINREREWWNNGPVNTSDGSYQCKVLPAVCSLAQPRRTTYVGARFAAFEGRTGRHTDNRRSIVIIAGRLTTTDWLQCTSRGRPHNLTTGLCSSSTTMVSPEPFPHQTRSLRACKKKWKLSDSDQCSCSETQTMSHTVESCPQTRLHIGLSKLHSADDDAVAWLTSHGS